MSRYVKEYMVDLDGNQIDLPAPNEEELLLPAERMVKRAFREGDRAPMARFDFQIRRMCREAAPAMIRGMIELAMDRDVDPRVRSVCMMGVVDRAGIRPKDFDPNSEEKQPMPLDVSRLSDEELADLDRLLARMEPEEPK